MSEKKNVVIFGIKMSETAAKGVGAVVVATAVGASIAVSNHNHKPDEPKPEKPVTSEVVSTPSPTSKPKEDIKEVKEEPKDVATVSTPKTTQKKYTKKTSVKKVTPHTQKPVEKTEIIYIEEEKPLQIPEVPKPVDTKPVIDVILNGDDDYHYVPPYDPDAGLSQPQRELKHLSRALKNAIANYDNAINRLSGVEAETTAKIEEYTRKKQEAENKLVETNTKVTLQQQNFDHASAELTRLQNELDQKVADEESKRQAFARLSSVATQHETENKAKIAEMQDELDKAIIQKTATAGRLIDAQTSKDYVQQRYNQAKDKVDELTNAITTLEETIQQEEGKVTQAKQDVQTAKDAYDAIKNTTIQDPAYVQAKAKLEEASLNVVEGLKNKKAAEDQLNVVTNALNEAVAKQDEVNAKVVQKRKELAEKQAEVAELETKIKAKKQEITSLEQQIQTTQGKLSGADAKITAAKGELDQAQQDLETKQLDVTTKQQELDAAIKAASHGQPDITQLKKAVKDAEQRYQNAVTQINKGCVGFYEEDDPLAVDIIENANAYVDYARQSYPELLKLLGIHADPNDHVAVKRALEDIEATKSHDPNAMSNVKYCRQFLEALDAKLDGTVIKDGVYQNTNDPTTLENVKATFDMMRKGNELRKHDPNSSANNKNELLVTSYEMALAQVNVKGSYSMMKNAQKFGHYRFQLGRIPDVVFYGAENLTQYTKMSNVEDQQKDMYKLWYDSEKLIYDEYKKKDPNVILYDLPQMDYRRQAVGHYLSLTGGDKQERNYSITGFAMMPESVGPSLAVQEFALYKDGAQFAYFDGRLVYNSHMKLRTVDEYEAAFMEYYNKVMNEEKAAKLALEEAKDNLANNRVDVSNDPNVIKARKALEAAKLAETQAKKVVEDQTTKVTQATNEKKEIEQSIDQLKNKKTSLDQELKQMKDQKDDYQPVIAKIETHLNNALEEQRQLNQKITEKKQEVAEQKVKVQQLEETYQDLLTKKQQAQAAFDQAKENLSEDEKQLEQTKQQKLDAYHAAEQALADLNQQIETKKQQLKDTKRNLEAAQSRMEVDEETLKQKKQDVEQLQAKLEQNTTKVNELSTALTTKKQEAANQEDADQAAVLHAKDEYDDASVAKNDKQKEVKQAGKVVDASKQSLTDAKKRVTNLNKEIDDASKGLDAAQKNRVKAINDAKDQIQKDFTAMKEKTQEVSKKLETYKGDEKDSVLEDAKKTVKEAQDRIDQVEPKQEEGKPSDNPQDQRDGSDQDSNQESSNPTNDQQTN